MAGTLYVMSQADYQRWLQDFATSPTLISRGTQLFDSYGCAGCHGRSGSVQAPALAGLYGNTVPLADGTTVTADEAYLRDSILQPKKQVVAGFKPIMPSFAGAIPDADLAGILAYLKALGAGNENIR
jgi:cytochrome c oxidase subunit 2